MELETLLQLTNNIVTLKNKLTLTYPITLTMDMIDLEATKKLIPRLTIEEWKAKYDPIDVVWNNICEHYYIVYKLNYDYCYTERTISNRVLGAVYFSTIEIAARYIKYIKAIEEVT